MLSMAQLKEKDTQAFFALIDERPVTVPVRPVWRAVSPGAIVDQQIFSLCTAQQ